jgi:E3 ubiquitin-protein ligase HERC2
MQPISSYLRQSDLASDDDYAAYVRDHIAIGMHVRCCRSYDDLSEGDVGHVVQLDRDGLHDLNLQVMRLCSSKDEYVCNNISLSF